MNDNARRCEHARTGELLFEPYALQQRWSASRALQSPEWVALLSEYLARLASECEESPSPSRTGRPVVGHIKLLALFSGQEYLRVSAVSAAHAPTVTGTAPDGLAEMSVTLNVLVYGLPRERLAALTSVVAAEVAGRWGAAVEEDFTPHGHQHQA